MFSTICLPETTNFDHYPGTRECLCGSLRVQWRVRGGQKKKKSEIGYIDEGGRKSFILLTNLNIIINFFFFFCLRIAGINPLVGKGVRV